MVSHGFECEYELGGVLRSGFCRRETILACSPLSLLRDALNAAALTMTQLSQG